MSDAADAPPEAGEIVRVRSRRYLVEGVVLDYDVAGNLVGIDIDNASTKVQMGTLLVNKLPVTVEVIAG